MLAVQFCDLCTECITIRSISIEISSTLFSCHTDKIHVTSDENIATILDVDRSAMSVIPVIVSLAIVMVLCEYIGDRNRDRHLSLSYTSLITWILLKLLDLQCSVILQSLL